MNWFTDKLYDLAASPRGGEGAWGELAAQDAMSPATRASYWAGSEMPKDPRIAGWRSPPRMGDTVAPPSDTAWMLPPEGSVRVGAPSQEVARRFGASGLTPPPARSGADAYRMGGMASMDEYRKAPDTAWRDIDRQAIEDQYGGTDIHGIKLPPVSADEPRAWRDAIIGETPADALVNWGLGGTGKLAKGALALGGLFKMADPAEAVFAGRLAKTADLVALKRAEQMGAGGASPNDIWTSTGWFQGADKKWRFEIPDQSSQWRLDPGTLKALQTAREPMAMGEAFSHPELMKAYPELYKADFSVGLQPGGAKATYSSGFGVDPPTISIHPDTAANMRSSNLHELQHGIQEIEGFATGGSVFGGLRPGTPEWKIYQDTLERIRTPTPKAELEKSGVLGPEYTYEDYLREHKQSIKNDKLGLDRMAQETAMREGYRRSAGEVEARTVQARDRMTPEQMRDIPWLYQDVPTEQQIVKFRTPITGMMSELADPVGGLLRGKPGGPWEGGIRAYHSSPHDFDKFDWSKLRTGEGANTYGAGFYFAENPAVSGQGGQYWSQFLHKFPKEEMRSAEWLRQHGFDREAATVELQRQIGDLQSKVKGIGSASAEDIGLKFPTAEDQRVYRDNLRHYYNDEIGKYQERLGRLQGNAPVGPRTYEVNIAARPELLLDWDKPLSQQPQLREPLTAAAKERSRVSPDAMDMYRALQSDPYSAAGYNVDRLSGENIYKSLRSPFAQKGPAASEALADVGIPGIRYLDQGSRGARDARLASIQTTGDGYYIAGKGQFPTYEAAKAALGITPPTYNYVVTDPSKLDIMAKYGIVGGAPVGMGALAAQDRYGGVP